MIFPKKQAQRLIPEYLLDYTTKLNESHPDPTESWGGSGSNYTAGEGININENVISVDNTIAKKSEIPTNYVTLDTEQTITGLKTITSRLTVGDNNGSNIFIDAQYDDGQRISIYNRTLGSEVSMRMDNDTTHGNVGAYFTYEDNKGIKRYRLPYQDATGGNTYTLATLNDIPTIPTLATVATTGSYNDLLDKPTIPDTSNLVTTNTEQTITGYKTFDGGIKCSLLGGGYTLQTIPVGWRYNFNDPQNPHQIDFSLPIEKSGTEYTLATTDDIPTIPTLATVATTGDYNDLNNKPAIPTTATSTSTLTPTTTQLVFTYADNTTETITLMTAATVSTTTTLS